MKKIIYFFIVIIFMVMASVILSVGYLSCDNANTSLNGVWDRGDIVVTITDDNGVFTQINSNSHWLPVVNNGFIRIGDTIFKNITRTGNLIWTAQSLSYISEDYTLGGWRDIEIIMDVTGQTLQISFSNVDENFINQSTTYTKLEYGHSDAYNEKVDYDRAIADYTEAIRLDPKNVEAYINRGWAYYMKNDYDNAIVDYTEAILLDSKNSEAYHYRGLVYYWKDDYDKAIADYNESIRFDSTSAWTYTSRGNVYYLKEDYDKAIVDFTEAIRLDPKSARRYKDRAEAYDKNGNYDRAIADYKAALRITPNDADIKQKLEEARRKLVVKK